jgi:hypothetical protein
MEAQQPKDKKPSLADVITKLDLILGENIQLRAQNEMLAKRIETLEILLQQQSIAPKSNTSVSTSITPEDFVLASSAAPINPPINDAPKTKFHALVLSDSIYRHVGGDCPKKKKGVEQWPIEQDILIPTSKSASPSNPPIKLKKVVMPGAKCDRLFYEAVRLSREFEFQLVVIHVGTNYFKELHPSDAIKEICEFLTRAKEIFKCNVTFSPILPRFLPKVILEQYDGTFTSSQLTHRLNRTIRKMNEAIYLHCQQEKIDSMLCPEFFMDDDFPVPDKKLLALDGCHLSRGGVVAMETALFEHILLKLYNY